MGSNAPKEQRMKLTVAAMMMTAVIAVACGEARISQPVSAQADNGAAVARGAYLVKTIGCSDCHTPMKMGANGPEPDLDRFLSGHPEQLGPMAPAKLDGPWMMAAAPTMTAWSGPWGVSYTANLTPDQNTGLGIWTEQMFVTALRTGRHMGVSRPIMPPMPWPAFRNASDDDLKAIYAYLRTIKPIVNHVPDYQPPAATATH
jgi:mono/diheme cytochrome c family protein